MRKLYIAFAFPCLGLRLFVIVFCFLTARLTSEAMTIEEFTQFLVKPPTHGHFKMTQITYIHTKETGITNRLVQDYEYYWNADDMFSSSRESNIQREGGIFKGVSWDGSEGSFTKYMGTNRNDSTRSRSALNGCFANLQALGIYFLVEGSARWDGTILDAEVNIPGLRQQWGVTPHMRGKFITLPDGTVKRLEYTVYIPGHEDQGSLDYSIDYRFDGSWGSGFPSYLAVNLVSEAHDEGNEKKKLLDYESEVHEWDITQVPPDNKMNPDILFTSSEQYLISNGTAYFLKKTSRNDKGQMSLVESQADQSAYILKQEQFKNMVRCLILAVTILPPILWGWHSVKKTKNKIRK